MQATSRAVGEGNQVRACEGDWRTQLICDPETEKFKVETDTRGQPIVCESETHCVEQSRVEEYFERSSPIPGSDIKASYADVICIPDGRRRAGMTTGLVSEATLPRRRFS